MKSISNSFSIKRLWDLIKCDILANRKQYLLYFIALFAMNAIILLFLLLSDPIDIEYISRDYSNITYMANGFMACVLLSYIMKPMSTKTKRISFLMLPATTAEKFISRLLIVTVGFSIMAIAANLIAMPTRFVYMSLLGVDNACYGTMVDKVYAHFFDTSSHFCFGHYETISVDGMRNTRLYNYVGPAIAYFFSYSWILFSLSIYVLGGNIWYKHPFVKTVGAIIVCVFGVSKIMSILFANDIITIPNLTPQGTLLTIGSICFVGFIVNSCLSYRLFKKSNIKRNGLFS